MLTKVLKGTFSPSIFVAHDGVYIADLSGMLDHYLTGQATLRVGDWSLFIVWGGRGKGEGGRGKGEGGRGKGEGGRGKGEGGRILVM